MVSSFLVLAASYPQEIKDYEERITGYGNDVGIASQHKPQGEDKFCPMTLNGVTYKEKADAGGMLLAICKENPLSQPIQIGSYRGFQMEVFYDTVNAHYCLNLCACNLGIVFVTYNAFLILLNLLRVVLQYPVLKVVMLGKVARRHEGKIDTAWNPCGAGAFHP